MQMKAESKEKKFVELKRIDANLKFQLFFVIV